MPEHMDGRPPGRNDCAVRRGIGTIGVWKLVAGAVILSLLIQKDKGIKYRCSLPPVSKSPNITK